MKVCTKCKEEKDESDFDKDITKKDGLYCSCKKCRKEIREKKHPPKIPVKSTHKICSRCKEEKNKCEFSKSTREKNGFQSWCKKCHKLQKIKNKEKLTIQKRNYYIENREEILVYIKNYHENNKERINNKRRMRYAENREEILKSKEKYYQENREKILTNIKEHYQKNKREIMIRQNKHSKERAKVDPIFKLRIRISSAIGAILKRNSGSKMGESIMKHLPYTIEELKLHLESQFEPWMTWENHGKYNKDNLTWQIDHKFPQASLPYDSMEHENFQKCWALSNLRPLLAIENNKKGSKILPGLFSEKTAIQTLLDSPRSVVIFSNLQLVDEII